MICLRTAFCRSITLMFVSMTFAYPIKVTLAQGGINQNSNGSCSPNIVGGANVTVVCPGQSQSGANQLASSLTKILTSIKPSTCPPLTEDQTRIETARLMEASRQATLSDQRLLAVQDDEKALGLWLCLPDQSDPWVKATGATIIGSVGMTKFQVGQTAEGCVLISYSYLVAKQMNDFNAQNFLQKFSECWRNY
jgi:hypothetical protein